MTINTWLPLFSGFYGSLWDEPDFDGEDDHFKLPEGRDFWEYVDWKKYHEHIAKKMCDEVETLLSDFVSSVKYETISSPKYYNFENDVIYCRITFNKRKVKKYLKENFAEFSKYIRDHYTSRDGFISFHSNDAEYWLDNFTAHGVGRILDFICVNETYEEPNWFEDTHISNFYIDEIYDYEIDRS